MTREESTDEASGETSRLRRWIREGPNDDDGTLGWMLGMALWWRMLITSVVCGVAVVAAMILAALVNPLYAALISLAIGFWLGGWATKISPKYDVTKNY